MTVIIGHRGARNLWAENSLTGFRNVLELGVKAVELDLHLSDSGELLVIHDATLDRTTDRRGPVRALSADERRTVRLKGPEGLVDDRIPVLEEVLGVLAPHQDVLVHVEIKHDGNGRPYPGLVERAADMLRRYEVADRAWLTCFDMTVLEACRRYAPEIRRLLSVNADWAQRTGGMEAFLTKAKPLVDIIAVHHELMDVEWSRIVAAHPRERLCVWTVNDEERLRHWLGTEIGYVTSDSPDLALGLQAA
ncbi:glycerophosphodiester phosphodiesterase family protein [Microvirga makkahensis]|uniref:Glycerophosphodiester phosphodiesterase n=1 Tax=Microvirga makkahensis TaxID=1128670 RepID=A0A7X3SN25_9HYPH|nr:glycerophosphodiester phosphodiesterase family protein [Microvirga makkahensis]MXQ10743.1 glycerophosphodiester phosphodiesterase [Microvirga makkahensis]